MSGATSTAERFRAALKKGLGRALLLMREAGDEGNLYDALLASCLTNQVFDRQIDEARTWYLHRLIAASGHYEKYQNDLLCALKSSDDASLDQDNSQIFGILCLAAQQNADFDRAPLRNFLLSADYDQTSYDCLDRYVQLEGVSGLLFCILLHGRRILENYDLEGSVFSSMREELIERDGEEAAERSLQAARADCPELDRLIALETESVGIEAPPPTPADYAAERASFDPRRGFSLAWIRAASDADLLLAAYDLLQQKDEQGLLHYFRLFGRRDYPHPPETLFPFLDSPNRRVAGGARRALSRLRHLAIRNLALQLITEHAEPYKAIELLTNNFEISDLPVIERLFDRVGMDEEALHSAGFCLLRLVYAPGVPTAAFRDLLMRLYEETPCCTCRHRTVKMLDEIGEVPDWMALEAQFDADSGTVEIAKAVLAKNAA
jgi:hypothetical protein